MVTIFKEVTLRHVADLFTISRFFLAGVFVWLGVFEKQDATSAVIFGVITGWTLDVLDGIFGRMSGESEESWAARHDFLADMVMVYGSLIFFTLAGYVPSWAFLLYSLIGALLIRKFPVKAMVMSIATPAVALPLVIAIFYEPFLRWIFIGWITVMLIFDWDRFVEVVEEYVEEMKSIKNRTKIISRH